MKTLFFKGVFLLAPSLLFAQSENEIIDIADKRKRLNYEISIAPNPSEGSVRIHALPGSRIQISSTSGTYVGTWIMEEGGLFFEELPAGSYVIMITNDDSVEMRKLLVL